MKPLISFLFFPLLCLCCGVLNAQQVSGSVKEKDSGIPLSGAVVSLTDSTGRVYEYVTSNAEGRFSLPIGKADGSSQIVINYLGYTSLTIKPPFNRTYDVALEPSSLNLSELVVRAKKVQVRGDTTEYSVPTLVSTEDRNLGDLLKKIPGIDVSKEGGIKYQGKAIGKLYIEGRDLLGSRYNIATQNLDPDDLASVSIYQNHQPIKALEGVIESNVTSINIQFKDNVKGKWVAALQAEAGGSTQKPHVPYSDSMLAMLIGKKYQGINTAKTDAAGNNIIYESDPNVFIFGVDDIEFLNRYRPTDYLAISHTYPPIDRDRTRFNTAYSVTSNHTFPVGENTMVSAGGKFEHNALQSGRSVAQTYLDGQGGSIAFLDINDVASQSYYASGDASIELNNKKIYIKDKFRFDSKGNAIGSRISGTETRMQDADDRDMNVFNYFKVTKNTGKWIFSVDMFTQYTQNKEIMHITAPQEVDTTHQFIDTKVFYNLLSFGNWIKIAKKIYLKLYTSIPILYRTFNTLTEGVTLSDPRFNDKMFNNVMLQYLQANERLFLEYKTARLQVEFGAEMWYKFLNYKLSEKAQDHKYAINPSVNVKYDFSPRLTAQLRSSYTLSDVNEQQLYDGLILQDYRYMSLGRTELTQNPNFYVSANLDFRDPLSGCFFVVDATYTASKSFQYTRYFVDDYILSYQSDEVDDYRFLKANATFTKAFTNLNG